MPTDVLARAQIRRFVDRFASLVICHLNPIYTRGEVHRVPELLKGIRQIQAELDERGPYFLGEMFSVADVAVAPFIGRMYALTRAGLIPDTYPALTESVEYSKFNAYAGALLARPSFQSTFVDEKVRRRGRGCVRRQLKLIHVI